MDKYKEYLDFAINIANHAGEIYLKYFNTNVDNKYKNDNTIVTIADIEINSYLIEQVKNKYPDHSVDGEEEQFGNSVYKWVCDPIDGTAMYARNIPTALFSLALVDDGEPIIGVVYDPLLNNMYTAIKENGAYLNGKKIHVNDIELDDIKSVANFDIWPAAEYDIIDSIKELGKKTYFVSVGSIIRASMAVATGDFTLAIFPGTKHKNCDIAAVKVIVDEAGGKVTNIFGHSQKYNQDIKGAIISNKVVHNEVVETIKKYIKE